MKKILLLVIALCLGALMLSAVSAQAMIYSGGDFASMAYYNGIYVAGPPGYAALSYGSAQNPKLDDAVVGVTGPLGILSTLNMSFTYSDLVGTSGLPFAAFGVSVDGLWGMSLQRYGIISLDGNQLSGSSQVHVWDYSADAEVAGTWGMTLNQVLSLNNPYNNVPYGNLEVMRAYAYIGDTGSPSYGSVNINSITVSSVPIPGAVWFLGSGLLGLVGLRRRFGK